MAVAVEEAVNQRGLVFIAHSHGGFMAQEQIQEFKRVFIENDYTAVLFDCANTLGESGGTIEKATATNYYHDLEDVIIWAKDQKWYEEPFCLVGHSLGGFTVSYFAEQHPEMVKALAPLSAVISGHGFVDNFQKKEPEKFLQWQKTGWFITLSNSKPGAVRKVPWSFIGDLKNYDLMINIDKIKCPVICIVGEKDTSANLEEYKIFYEALSGQKEYHIIPEAWHVFRKPEEFKQIHDLLDAWIKKIA